MSVNQVDASNGQITLQGDHVVHHQSEIGFALEGDRLPDMLKGSHKGDMFITNMRLIFINKGKSGYKSFAMNFQYIRNFEVKQPIFGSNFLKGFIKAEPNGGWEGNANFKIDFPKGGAIDFAEMFQKTVKESIRQRNSGMGAPPPMQPAMYPQPGMYSQPGMYAPPPGMQSNGFYPPPPQAPGAGYYAYQPGMPPQGGPQQPLYSAPTGQAPPPYETAAGNSTMYPTVPGTEQPPASSKAQEAYLSGSNVYVPNNDAPPPYNPSYDKKDQ